MHAEAIARRFPLVSRVKPPGRSLDERITALGQTRREPTSADRYTWLAKASEVLNVAALIASDCGMPELARSLCWEHYEIFDAARPLPFEVARLALQPVLNIPRQMIRDGDGAGAYDVLTVLLNAARRKGAAIVDDHRIDMTDVTLRPEDHKEICTGLWAAVLTDGPRALAQAGRWTEAAEAMQLQRGVGTRLLDGRQVSILALIERGCTEQAVAMVDDSVTNEPWEIVVGSVLRAYCLAVAGVPARGDLDKAIEAAQQLVQGTEPATVVFRVRVGLTALELARQDVSGGRLGNAISVQAASDAYAAREALESGVLRDSVNHANVQHLRSVLEASGLGLGFIPVGLKEEFEATVQGAREELRRLLV